MRLKIETTLIKHFMELSSGYPRFYRSIRLRVFHKFWQYRRHQPITGTIAPKFL